ncbi:MAG: hypothetical protein ACK4GF_15845, partial [Acinetobacter johnsonii]
YALNFLASVQYNLNNLFLKKNTTLRSRFFMSKPMKFMLTRVVENKLELNARAFKVYGGHG